MKLPFAVVRRLPLALLYFVTASLSVGLTRFDGGVAFLWVANALLMADLMGRARREWMASLLPCAIASFFATSLFGLGWALALPFVLVNMIEAVVGAWLFRRLGSPRLPLGSLSWLMNFTFAVGIVAPLVAAALAALTLWTVGRAPHETLVIFFAGHSLGNLTVAPLAMLVARAALDSSLMSSLRRYAIEGSLMLILVVTSSLIVFTSASLPLLFVPILPIILVTFRLGRGAAAGAILLLALIGGGATLAGQGPIHLASDIGINIQFFQFYLAATVLTVLPVAADLANRRRLLRDVRLSEERYRLLADYSSDILLHLNRDGKIRYVSPSIALAGGHQAAALIGLDCSVLVAPDHRDRVRAFYLGTLAAPGATRTFDYLGTTADGSIRWFETHTRVILDDDQAIDGVLSVIRDITARKAMEQRLAEDAMTDALTGLPNRRAFHLALERSAVGGGDGRDCLAVLDIDHFKGVNDSFGHAAGDEVLRGFARVARRIVRDRDLVARIGGEEFAIFFPDTSVDQAMAICDRLRSEISRSALHAGSSMVRVTVSGGVAPLGPQGIDHALATADLAMYSAKRNGRDQLALAA